MSTIATPALSIEALSLTRSATAILSHVDLHLAAGQIGCLLGPSGCGKTTLLRAIAGFENIQSGSIHIAGRCVADMKASQAPEARGIGMVFQDYALFPHLTVAENIVFGLHKLSKSEQQQRCQDWLERLQLSNLTERYPHQLSGGQQQRVALARALAPQPQLLLMDEPFANLDASLRESLSLEVRDLLKSLGASALLVTHDPTEAFTLADVIGVMQQGRIVQWDSPYRVYHEPANRFVASFVGLGSFLQSQVTSPRHIHTPLGLVHGQCTEQDCASEVSVLVRPDDIVYDPLSSFRAKVIYKAFQGPSTLYRLALPDQQEVVALLPSHIQLTVGDETGIRFDTGGHVVAFA
ncbi:MAG: ABC transporter ATP-binding protein [Gammaproteobacteria bacterium]|nr:ABC transporter ATP-binding protein [Gammaproteobacteria bacterium]